MSDPAGGMSAHLTLAPWADFYVITGSAAAALTGLQLVAQALVAQRVVPVPSGDAAEHTTAAFGTPTVVHFAAALLLSAALSAPWPSLGGLRPALLVAGAAGLGYVGVVLRRAHRQTGYAPLREDWAWHVALPAVTYGGLALAAGLARASDTLLFGVAGAVLLLLCIALHNAWDGIMYLTGDARPARADPNA